MGMSSFRAALNFGVLAEVNRELPGQARVVACRLRLHNRLQHGDVFVFVELRQLARVFVRQTNDQLVERHVDPNLVGVAP